MVARPFAPDRGDFVSLNFTPQAGHEQAGSRPALVLSPKAFNARTGLCFACPLTNTVRGWPFEVIVPPASGLTGVILSHHVRSLDWRARSARFIARADQKTIDEVSARISAILSG